MHSPEESIAALATPPGEGALAVIRISGPQALETLHALASSGGKAPRVRPRYCHHLFLRDRAGRELDEVLAVWMPGPKSYTGEDLVEISSHGGPATVKAILNALYGLGIRPAHPGEFTYRAFLSGRLDLVQAEAVADLVHSRSERARELALHHLGGSLSRRLERMRSELLALLRDLEAGIDFSEEDIEFVSRPALRRAVKALRREVEALLAGAEDGRLLREGVQVVLAGEPNVGKSSLFNALLEAERAIVTESPGTTRDVIRESWVQQGLVFHLHDTAGLREAVEEAERLGVERSESAVKGAGLVLWVMDGCRAPTAEERRRWAGLRPERDILIVNKCDRPDFDAGRAEDLLPGGVRRLAVSAKRGDGIGELRSAMVELALSGRGQEDLEIEVAINRRQEARLQALRLCLEDLSDESLGCMESEVLARQLRDALAQLEELTGESISEQILEEIFARFCIGK